MAVVKYGSIVTEIKGKIGGTVFQGGISGPVAGNKNHLSISNVTLGKQNRSTSSKIFNQHGTLAYIAGFWQQLTDLERAAWNAAAIGFPFKNKFGEMYTGSGYQVYMSLAINSLNMGQGLLSDPPIPSALAVASPYTIEPFTDPNTFEITTTVNPNSIIVIYATTPLSAGVAMRTSFLKAITKFDEGASMPADLTAAYKAVYGHIPNHGNVWWRAIPVSLLDFRQGVPVDLKYSW